MFTIDFTKPWLYKDIIYFNQGNLSTNNTLRCKLVTGGSDDFTGGSIACTFTTKDSIEISGFGRLIDAKGGIVDIVFPSNALVVGTNKLEVLVNRADGGVAQSPSVMYDIWQGLTTGNGIEAETNYPILIQLINSTNEASNKANLALNKANSMITDITDAIDNAYRSANEADIATSSANAKIEEVETAKTEMIKKVDTSIVTMKSDVEVAKNEMASKADEKIADVDRALAAGTKDLEVKESRRDMDGVEHDTLKLRLESDLKKGKVIEETKEGTYLSFNDTVGGIVSDIEVLGNTVQDVTNLANISSSCIPNGDGTFKMSILSCGENLIPSQNLVINKYYDNNGNMVVSDNDVCDTNYYRINSNSVTLSRKSGNIKKPIKILTYSKDKVFIQRFQSTSLADDVYSASFNSDVKYIRIGHSINDYDLKLQEGTVATPYTPYQETRCDIKLPCQLEKVGDISDRLYFDKVENAWCIEKRVLSSVITDSMINTALQNWTNVTPLRIIKQSNDVAFNAQSSSQKVCFEGFKLNNTSAVYENTWDLTVNEGKYSGGSAKDAYILFFNKGISIEQAKATMIGKKMYYIALTPQKIVLPQSEQIKLNSFANKTHIYTISGDVDATVKATVSKSLASTVQANTNEINILSDKIADIQGLKESQDFEYELPNGQNYLVCKDTQNGVVKDLKVYGKSLVNNFSYGGIKLSNGIILDGTKLKWDITNQSWLYASKIISNIKPNTIYTLICDIGENTLNNEFILMDSSLNNRIPTKNILIPIGSKNRKVVTTFKSKDNVNANEFICQCQANTTGIIEVSNIMIIEGDHTQNPPQYFEGIASVGNGNEIEVLSRKEDGNLFDGELELGDINTEGKLVVNSAHVRSKNNITVLPQTKYYFYLDTTIVTKYKVVYCYDNKNQFIKLIEIFSDNNKSFVTPENCSYIKFKLEGGANINGKIFIGSQNLKIDFNTVLKQDKKPILFKDTDGAWKPVTELRGIDLNNCDTIENDKYNVKTNKTVLNGEGDYYLSTGVGNQTNTIMLGLRGVPFKKPTDDKLKNHFLCSNANQLSGAQTWNDDVEGVSLSINGIIFIRLSKSKATDLVSAKEYLKNNPIPLIYLTNEVKEYDTNPLDLESFENETMISFGSAVIAPYASWKITSSLPNFAKELSNQIKQLQDQVYKTNVASFTVALNALDTKLRLDRLEAPQQ